MTIFHVEINLNDGCHYRAYRSGSALTPAEARIGGTIKALRSLGREELEVVMGPRRLLSSMYGPVTADEHND